ncbi:MAG TPA: putative Ig domain-containing protein, partial [Candidatus Acidoferrum sp.]|nr:putative Ig domain-containing protein [Candidatus Acidoferrum sp.]
MRLPSFCISLFVVSACFTCGCGGGGGSSTAPPAFAPTFTSVPPTAADEGADYTYQPVAASPDGTAVTFSLSSSPTGATLSAGVLSWTPTHDQSRVPNQFSVTATNGKGGSATQSWTVTPSGVVAISDVITYWNSAGPQAQPVAFLP